jgi:hypothetical protein
VNDTRTEKEVAMSDKAKVVQFPTRPKSLEETCGGVWICGCGNSEWRLYANGVVLCTGCNCITTVLKVIEDRLPGAS